MGKGRAGGFSGTRGASPPRSVRDNFDNLRKEFHATKDGLFGKPSPRKSSKARIIESDDPLKTARRFFEIGSEGGTIDHDNPGVTRATFADDSLITFREISRSGGPAVEITIVKGRRPRKIHFERTQHHD